MGWKSQYGDIDPYEDDEKPTPSEYDGELIEDAHGEYNPYAGSESPTAGRCSAVLKFSHDRYDETRFCTALPEWCFAGDKGSDFCKHHKSREALVKQQYDSFKTGAYAQSYLHVFDKITPDKQIVAAELYQSLVDESRYDFEPEIVSYEIDTSDVEWVVEDVVEVEMPVPTEKEVRCQALWYAALDFVKIQNINETLFESAFDDDVGVGERIGVVASGESGAIEDKMEHHLNLVLSRIEKDYKTHLELGGVNMSSSSDGDVSISVDNREWTASLPVPDEDQPSVEEIPIE